MLSSHKYFHEVKAIRMVANSVLTHRRVYIFDDWLKRAGLNARMQITCPVINPLYSLKSYHYI